MDIAGFLERYGSWGVWERVGTRARPQRDRTACTMCASRLARSPVCTRGEPCSPLDPEWRPVAPTSPRCWSSENNLNKVSLPRPAPSSPPHSPSARSAPHARLSHALLRAAQVAMMALLGAREHLARPLAQLELLYNRIPGSAAALAGAGAPWRVRRDRSVSVCRRPGASLAPLLCIWTRKYLCL